MVPSIKVTAFIGFTVQTKLNRHKITATNLYSGTSDRSQWSRQGDEFSAGVSNEPIVCSLQFLIHR